MTISEAIHARRSIRKFKEGEAVTDEQVGLLLEAAMLAPSACNMRPWEFIVLRDREKLDKIRAVHPYTKMLATASLAIIVCALPDTQDNAKCCDFYPQDCGAATQNILLQAVELGLGTCWCGVYPKEKLIGEVRNILGMPDILPFNIIAVGVPDEAPAPRGAYDESKVRLIS